ncbi:MAG TPA: DNA ligase D [Pseudolabrys sp.]|nr:DNA ligase D [Pseudolabrys sp.]
MPKSPRPDLKTYRGKRHFDVTREPKGKVERRRGNAFVIQKHAARRLHYDLRLELDGVMKSWAVTRGPSLVPGEKRLAVQVEDHPIEYNKFEGTIPEGEYGGGTVLIWDRGRWFPENDPHKGLAKGHLSFRLEGKKLSGGWHLVRMHRRPGEKRDNWLLIKQHDDAERSARDKDILEEQPLSVATGRSLEEIASNPKRIWHSNRSQPAPPALEKTAKNSTPKTARKKIARKKRSATAPANSNVQVRRSRADDTRSKTAHRAPLPSFVEPCLATLTDKAPSTEQWIHEIKFDGYRIQARLDRGNVKLLTRKGLDWTHKFPTIARAIAKLPAASAIIDGEVVAEGDDGISSFSLLQQDLKSGRYDRMALYAFDLLHLDGADLKPEPLTLRKQALSKLLRGISAPGPLRLSESLTGSGTTLLRHACKLGLEGIVSKLADSPYRSGRGRDWVKTKCSDRQEFVVAGVVPSTADAHAVGALVLGFHENGKLHYAGRTGTGFTHETARSLFRKLMKLRTDRSPFQPLPAEERGVREPIWVEPRMVVEVDFHGWTHGGRIRQASFQGIREDKSATEVVREKASPAVSRSEVKRSTPQKSKETTVAGVRLTHPERLYWEDAGVTKRDLADFYAQIWTWMKPHLVRRPLALVRCPEGSDLGQCFFQKHARAGIPVQHLHLVEEKGDNIISIDDLDGLIALVQGGVLEIHTRGTTIDDRERADRLVFDLDPGPGTGWRDVVSAAREVHKRLSDLKLRSFVKTSGGKGLHVVLPISPTPWEEAKDFTRAIATSMEADSPERYISTASKSRRTNRIFVDYLRNSREATAVAPYSTRARPGAPVSVPVDWSELGNLKSASQYTVGNLQSRLSRLRKDPWAGIGRIKQPLPDPKRMSLSGVRRPKPFRR